MSQGDATFNATLQIKTLLNELSLVGRKGSGYKPDDAMNIVEGIRILREKSIQEEQEWNEFEQMLNAKYPRPCFGD